MSYSEIKHKIHNKIYIYSSVTTLNLKSMFSEGSLVLAVLLAANKARPAALIKNTFIQINKDPEREADLS